MFDRELVGRLLGSLACLNVRYSANGHEALASIEREEPEIVLTDLIMPDMDGLELCARSDSDIRALVILMTAHGSEDVAMQALLAARPIIFPKKIWSAIWCKRSARPGCLPNRGRNAVASWIASSGATRLWASQRSRADHTARDHAARGTGEYRYLGRDRAHAAIGTRSRRRSRTPSFTATSRSAPSYGRMMTTNTTPWPRSVATTSRIVRASPRARSDRPRRGRDS